METSSDKLKKRFCKDNNVNIQLFNEPYFTERLKLFNKYEAWTEFTHMLETEFNNDEQKFLDYYMCLTDDIIAYIKDSEAFKTLNNADMNLYSVNNNIESNNLFKVENIGKRFISLDMVKANFNSLVYYGNEINKPFYNSYNWYEFIKQFTPLDYFYKSKYIRQIIFGNCNPKRQTTFEKYLIDKLFNLFPLELKDRTCVFCKDELVINITDASEELINNIYSIVLSYEKEYVPIKIERFMLGKVLNSDGYIKNIYNNSKYRIEYEVKCAGPLDSVFIHRILNNEEITDNDLVFDYNGKQAKLIEKPNLSITYNIEDIIGVVK